MGMTCSSESGPGALRVSGAPAGQEMIMRGRYTRERIIALPRQEADLAAGLTISQVCQKLGISEPTFHRWRQQYGGLKADDAKRLKELELENERLKRVVAQLALDKQMLQEVVQKKF